MKLSQLRTCDGCGEGLLQSKDGSRYAMFYIVTVDRGLLRPGATQRVMGLAQYFSGSLALAEVMGPDADDAVAVASDTATELKKDELMLCQRCYLWRPVGLIVEEVNARQDQAEELAARVPAIDAS